MPFAATNSTPLPSAIAPGVFIVPLSKLSGKKSGWFISPLALPVPPSIRVLSGNLPSVTRTPVPIGPYKPLCPGAHMIFMPSDRLSGITPAACAQSAIRQILCLRHSAAISESGVILPFTLQPAVITITAVSRRISRSSEARSSLSLFPLSAML